jgi:hypothetical protein
MRKRGIRCADVLHLHSALRCDDYRYLKIPSRQYQMCDEFEIYHRTYPRLVNFSQSENIGLACAFAFPHSLPQHNEHCPTHLRQHQILPEIMFRNDRVMVCISKNSQLSQEIQILSMS